jgi:glycosyltransferase involved in cell wall biosynthesis
MRDQAGPAAVAVVIPTFNRAMKLADQLRALERQDYRGDWELLIADNGCMDDTADVVASFEGRLPVRLIDASARRGPAAARNAAIAQSSADLVLFLDDDDYAAPTWLSRMVDSFDGPCDVLAGGVAYDFMRREKDRGAAFSGLLPYGVGANLGIRRSVLESLGGFDPTLRIAEDVDLCWRAQLQGFTFARNLEAVVYRRPRGSLFELFSQKFGYGQADVELFVRYRAHGMKRSLLDSVRVVARLLLTSPHVLRRRTRSRWIARCGLLSGRLVGSIRQRVMYLA